MAARYNCVCVCVCAADRMDTGAVYSNPARCMAVRPRVFFIVVCKTDGLASCHPQTKISAKYRKKIYCRRTCSELRQAIEPNARSLRSCDAVKGRYNNPALALCEQFTGFRLYEVIPTASPSPPPPPAPFRVCDRFRNLLECAERRDIPVRSAQKQQHRSVSRCSVSFVAKFAVRCVNDFVSVQSKQSLRVVFNDDCIQYLHVCRTVNGVTVVCA